jgi:hypothetical protein
MGNKSRGIITKTVYIVFAIFLAIQLVPYGRHHTNPPVLNEPRWDRGETRDLVRRACFDCHSNQTVWPEYAMVAPVSWLVYSDVTEGREHLNFTEWGMGSRKGENPDKIRKEIEEGEMPPFKYLIAHPEARLSDDEKRSLIDGLTKTINR